MGSVGASDHLMLVALVSSQYEHTQSSADDIKDLDMGKFRGQLLSGRDERKVSAKSAAESSMQPSYATAKNH